MQHLGFFDRAGPFTVDDIARKLGAEIPDGDHSDVLIDDVRSLDEAGPGHLTFIDNKKYLGLLAETRATVCLVAPAYRDRVPKATLPLVMRAPYRGFAESLWLFYPGAGGPLVGGPGETGGGTGSGQAIHPSAEVEEGAIIEPGAIVCAEARIGAGTRIAAGAVVGYRCMVGRGGFIGAGASVTHALIGDRVLLHAGVRVGQDGFGFSMGGDGHRKVPQIGRVIIQDDVEIGANTCIDRGALKDTIIGEGTKIDNLVQIGHNAVIGRHCVIVGQVGIAGSAELGDFVVVGGQAGIAGHVKIGAGAQIAGGSHAKDDVPAGARLIGTPAKPIKEWMKEQLAVQRLGRAG